MAAFDENAFDRAGAFDDQAYDFDSAPPLAPSVTGSTRTMFTPRLSAGMRGIAIAFLTLLTIGARCG